MIDRSVSVHLQDFPNVSFIEQNDQLERDMDLVRDVCSTVLGIRDQKNLRVRLPLKSVIVIGQNAQKILSFKDIIADEINVKDVQIENDIANFADFKLQINFKKIGAKHGAKMKEILNAVKEGNWQKTADSTIKIADIELLADEFELKLLAKQVNQEKFVIEPLSNNDCLVMLDIELTKELEDEGIARDIVRAIQQNRKEADLNVSDRINITLSGDSDLLDVVENFNQYIAKQVLADEIKISYQEVTEEISFENQIDDKKLIVGIDIVNG